MEVVGESIDIAFEELTESHPEFSGGSSITKNEIKDLDGDLHVDPLYDGEIILDPLRIMRLRDGVGGDVGAEIASPKVDVEDLTPMVVVVGAKI